MLNPSDFEDLAKMVRGNRWVLVGGRMATRSNAFLGGTVDSFWHSSGVGVLLVRRHGVETAAHMDLILREATVTFVEREHGASVLIHKLYFGYGLRPPEEGGGMKPESRLHLALEFARPQ